MRQGRMLGLEKILQQRHRMAHGAVATLGTACVMRLSADACTGRVTVRHQRMHGRSGVGMGRGRGLDPGVGVSVGVCQLNMPVTGLWILVCSERKAG